MWAPANARPTENHLPEMECRINLCAVGYETSNHTSWKRVAGLSFQLRVMQKECNSVSRKRYSVLYDSSWH
jgi:hypothetical protein